MKFGAPQMLWSLLIVPVFAAAFILLARLRARRWQLVADRPLFERQTRERSSARIIWRAVLWCFGLLLACVALARPQYGASTVKQTRRGLDLVVAIDTSKSMLAKDLLPDRLTRAKLDLQALLKQLQGDRVGFVAFAGQAFVQCPLTSDYSAAKVFLRALDTKTIPRGGTAIAEALRTADQLLEEARSRGGSKSQVVVVITDGEDHEGDAVMAAKALHEKGVSVFTVGVGSTVGEPIPMYSERGDFTGYMKDSRGTTVLSRLNESALKEIASAGGGRYVASSTNSTGVEALVTELAGYEREERDAEFKVVYTDRFQWALVPGALMLMLAAALSPRSRVALLLLLMASTAEASVPWPTLQNSTVKQANTALSEGRPDEALQSYDKVKEELSHRAELWLNEGMAQLKKGDPKAAEPLLQRALLAEDKGLRARAHYLLGNAAFDAKDFKAAVDEYKKSLRDDPKQKDTKYNLEVAQKLLKQEQQKQDEQNKKDDQKKDEQKKDEQKQDQKQDQKKPEEQKSDEQKQKEEQQKQEQQKQEQQQQENRPQDDKEQSRQQLLDSLQAEEKPLRFDLFKAQQQKKKQQKQVEKDW